jgi:ribose transport system permease protein
MSGETLPSKSAPSTRPSIWAFLGSPTVSRIMGVLCLVLTLYFLLMISDANARSLQNHQNLARRIGEWGIVTLGAAFVIITGGIDLSIGSVVCLSAVTFGILLENGTNPILASAIVLVVAGLIGLFHGLLITKLNLQPFVVTLCGLFIYRGLAQLLTLIDFKKLHESGFSGAGRLMRDSSRDVGVGGRKDLDWFFFLQNGEIQGIPTPLILFFALAVLAGIFLHASVYGRYLFALGYNEQATRYAGVNTDRYKILAYFLCSLLAGLGGLLFLMKISSASPSSAGNWFELYAITGAVLGGTSLRGGEGTIIGIMLGTAVLPLLKTLVIFAGIPSDMEFSAIGVALLLGTLADELLRRRSESASKLT